MDIETPSRPSGLSPSIEILGLTTDETTQVMSVEEAGAHVEVARLGPYELGECIGKGGMAVVYRARVVGPFGFEKQLVVKRLQPALSARPEFFRLFTEEARLTAQLSHPGIVQVHDFGVIDGAPFLVMELVDGVNLAQVWKQLDGARLPVDAAVVIVTQLCHALGYAHGFRDRSGVRRQVVHGDVSPSNIMVCKDGSAKLLDFGVAKLLGEFDFELPPMLTGKSAYMAPEQLRRQPFDRRVDVFAAGIVLHELLSGRRLFAARSDVETLHRVLEGQVDRPSRWNPAVSRALDAVTLRALEADPGDRFESGEEMAGALEAACRVSGGRRRVAEVLETLLARPGEGEAPDHTLLQAALERSPLPLPPLPQVERPQARPFRPRSITEMVRPLPPPAPRRKLWKPIVLSALIGFALVVGAPLIVHRTRPTPPMPPPPRPRRALRHFAFHAAPPPSPTSPVEEVEREVARPVRRHHAKPSQPVEIAPHPVEVAAPPVEVAPPVPPTVKDGRLLDPFSARP